MGIGRLERFAADYEREHAAIELPAKVPQTGKKVAIVGAGLPYVMNIPGENLGDVVSLWQTPRGLGHESSSTPG